MMPGFQGCACCAGLKENDLEPARKYAKGPRSVRVQGRLCIFFKDFESGKDEENMRWGILATGTIARKFADTVRAMEKEGEVLEAAASRRIEAAQAFADEFGAKKAYGSYDELLRDPEVEAVYIATPNNLHYENARDCLEAGKHVLCEKPFTTSAEQAEALYALAEQKGLFVMEAFWVRFLPVLQKMQEIIASGEIGEVVHARSDYGFIAKGARKDRKFNSDLGGGALLDIGIYNLGFMHMVMGEAPVSFSSRVHINEYGTDDFSNILLEYPGQRTADITTAIGMDIPREAAIFGTKGSITLPDFQKAERMTVRLYEGDSYNVEIPFEVNGFEYQIREASRCVAEKLSTSKILKAEDSLTILKLMDDIRESWGMKFAFEG